MHHAFFANLAAIHYSDYRFKQIVNYTAY